MGVERGAWVCGCCVVGWAVDSRQAKVEMVGGCVGGVALDHRLLQYCDMGEMCNAPCEAKTHFGQKRLLNVM